MAVLDLTGRTFGRLTVINDDGTRSSRAIAWLCRCDCGKLTHVRTQVLKSGAITSCGHVQRAKLPELQEKRRESSPEGTRIDQLGDTPIRNSATGYRNISLTQRYGRLQYRVSVVYQRHQHGGLCDAPEERLIYAISYGGSGGRYMTASSRATGPPFYISARNESIASPAVRHSTTAIVPSALTVATIVPDRTTRAASVMMAASISI